MDDPSSPLRQPINTSNNDETNNNEITPSIPDSLRNHLSGETESECLGMKCQKKTLTCIHLVSSFILLIVIGAGLFYWIESPNELARIQQAKQNYTTVGLIFPWPQHNCY